MRDFPFEIISSSSSVTRAFSVDNSIINTRNVDTVPPMEIALHAHPYYSIIYVADCELFTTYIDGCAINYRPGNVYFNPPNTLHTPKNQFGGMLSSVSLKLYISDSSLAEKLGSFPFYAKCNEELNALFARSIQLTNTPEPDSLSLLYENTESILTKLCSASKCIIQPKGNVYDSHFIRVLKYMYKNCGRDIDLSELANVAHMERTAFARKFKSMYKITPINYLYSVRLSRSLDHLMSPDIPITKIAGMVGFRRATAFAAAFARTFAMTPTEYRERLEKTEAIAKLKRV